MDGESTGTGSAEARTTAHPARCPRCGYDQQGIMLQWRDQCPLRSTCTECGLTFHWREVLGRQEPIADWCIEAQPTLLSVLRRMPSTLFMLLRPGRFWRTLKMWQPIQPRALLWYIAAMLVISYFALGLVHAVAVIPPFIFSTVPPALSSGPQPYIAFVHALLFPFSSTSADSFGLPPHFPLAAPASILNSFTGEMLAGLCAALVFQAMIAACFVLLPQSRRKAKVRWPHIARIALYSLGYTCLLWITLAAGLITAFLSQFSIFWSVLAVITDIIALILIVALLPLHIAWWWFATSRYLHMPHGLGISVAVHVLAALVTIWLFFLLGLAQTALS